MCDEMLDVGPTGQTEVVMVPCASMIEMLEPFGFRRVDDEGDEVPC